MITRKKLKYLEGYVNIKVEGFYVERFINLCINKRIHITDIKRKKETIIYANIGLQDYKKLKQIAKKTKTKIKIQGKKGLPFLAHRYKKRRVFIVLFISVITIMIILSNYIWNIEITGNVKIGKEEIIKTLEENGLSIGKLKNDININEVIRSVRMNRDDIAWMGITIKGTNVLVKIKETDKAPDIIDSSGNCNIISDKYGVITKINVQNGTAAVKEGDIIEPGMILVNGYIDGKYTERRYVHSIAEIEARVWYTKKKSMPFRREVQVSTGRMERKYSIKLKKNQINLFKTLSKFEKYDTIREVKKVMVFSNFYLPIEILKTTNIEYEFHEKSFSEAETKDALIDELQNELIEEVADEGNIINKSINYNIYDECIEVELTLETIEKIGVESYIDI